MLAIEREGKTIGFWDKSTKVFSKKVNNAVHLMKKYDAYAVDKRIFDLVLKAEGLIEITDEKNNVYTISSQEARSHGVVDEFGQFGMQMFIPRTAFKKSKVV